MLCVYDDGGSGLRNFAGNVGQLYKKWIGGADHTALVNGYLHNAGSSYRPYVIVTSCPGDMWVPLQRLF